VHGIARGSPARPRYARPDPRDLYEG
jgi:hypothetical protein